ncbi:MAG: GNAT family N-acetyltransferase [Deltaproteobacteria bacterium]|nr:GNAT family N-acetyltransferase [Deltaproteobacteria bacterium]
MDEPRKQRTVTPIEIGDTESDFSCGRPELDVYLIRHAFPNEARGIDRTYVLRRRDDEPELPRILGFHTLGMALIESAHVADILKGKLPKYPLPVALIGRLAVDLRAQGRGFGELLLMDALRRVVNAAAILGCVGVIVDAKDQAAASFYAKYDFVPVGVDALPRRLYLPMSTILSAFENRPG